MRKTKVNWWTIWMIGLFACLMLEIPFWWILVMSICFVVVFVLLRFWLCIFWLGYFLQGFGRKTELAVKLYDKAYSHGARAGVPMIAYAMQLLSNGAYPKGLEVLREVQRQTDIRQPLQSVSRQDLAIAMEKNGNISGAIDEMETLLQEYGDMDSNFYSTLSYFYIQAGDYGKAEEANDLSRTDPEKGAYYDNMALIAYRQGDLSTAKALFEKALETEESMLSPRFYLGLLAEAEGDMTVAAEHFRAVYEGGITGLSTVPREAAAEKYRHYWKEETDESTAI